MRESILIKNSFFRRSGGSTGFNLFDKHRNKKASGKADESLSNDVSANSPSQGKSQFVKSTANRRNDKSSKQRNSS